MTYPFDEAGTLAKAGLNLHAVFELAALPEDTREALSVACGEIGGYRQLILLGHGGRALWRAMEGQKAPQAKRSADPVDAYSEAAVHTYLEASPACAGFQILYPPSSSTVPLIQLGELAGWHHASKFGIGINADWGSWFAYRALVLADSRFAPVARPADASPCDTCRDKPCIAACPATAVTDEAFLAARCFGHRLADGSACAQTCHARLACPVAQAHRYGPEQMRYHYGRSLETLRDYRKRGLV